jgi:hypothetical protein
MLLGWGTELDFQVNSAELDLKTWQGFIQRNLLLKLSYQHNTRDGGVLQRSERVGAGQLVFWF